MPLRQPSSSICRFCEARPLGLCKDMHTDQDFAYLQSLQFRIRSFRAGTTIYGPHDPKTHVFNIMSGWVAISHELADGQRQISQFLTTGALFGYRPDGLSINGQVSTAMDEVTVCAMPSQNLAALLDLHPAMNKRLTAIIGRDSLVTSNRLAYVGQAKAVTRIANLLLELLIMVTGRTDHPDGTTIRLPLTQAQIADATGLTAVHVNRMLRQLREEKIVDLHDGKMTVIRYLEFFRAAQLTSDMIEIWRR